MALPPDPIDEVLPQAAWVVDAEVQEVVLQGPAGPKPEAPEGFTSVEQKVGSQVVRLKVRRVLKGNPEVQELLCEKPVGAYALRAGNHGPFLLDASAPHPVILGRYGPDSYSLKAIEAALQSAAR